MLHFRESHRQLQARIAELVERRIQPQAVAIEGSGAFPEVAYKAFAREKLFTLAMPKAYGGPEADATSLALMVETISTVSPSAALLVFPTNAVLRTVALCGSAEQKDRIFAEIKKGDKPMAFCLTEPDHGSDAASLATRAQRDGDHYIVNGSKTYITLGPHAHYYLTFVRTGEGPKAAGISTLLIPRDAPGLNFGPAEKKMGLHGSVTSQMFLDNCRVPVANRLWDEGEGWRVLSEVANPMRVWGAASMALGNAQGLFSLALQHARLHTEGQKSLLTEQSVGFALADMKMRIEACRSLIYRTCAMIDAGTYHPREIESFVSMAKCHTADTGVQVAELASRVIGRAMMAEDHPAAQLFRVAKAIQIFDGSNQIQRLIVARNLAFA